MREPGFSLLDSLPNAPRSPAPQQLRQAQAHKCAASFPRVEPGEFNGHCWTVALLLQVSFENLLHLSTCQIIHNIHFCSPKPRAFRKSSTSTCREVEYDWFIDWLYAPAEAKAIAPACPSPWVPGRRLQAPNKMVSSLLPLGIKRHSQRGRSLFQDLGLALVLSIGTGCAAAGLLSKCKILTSTSCA